MLPHTLKERAVEPEQLNALLQAVGDAKHVLILPHNDPDPDAVATALALRHLLTRRLDVKAEIIYKGLIGRAENKALIRYLGKPLRRLTGADLRQLAGGPAAVALVDTQPGAGNNALPPHSPVAIVLDHHPRREATATAVFADVRTNLGATSTMVTEYLRAAGVDPPAQLATALFYGIKTDTLGLARGVSSADVDAYFYLQPRIDVEALVDIEQAQVPPAYFQSLDATLRATHIYGGVAVSYVGTMRYPDLVAEMADLLLRLQGIFCVLCMGQYQDDLVLSIRTQNHRLEAGTLAQQIVGEDGAAGGHGNLAGGQIPLDGRSAKELAQQLGQRLLQHIYRTADVPGKPLI
jgi:nanoRNase/pAp phosphatase (c-di-AMP/oligoRNAs hydrolase)